MMTTNERVGTPWKINMEHNNGGLEDDFPFQGVIFRFHVNFPGCRWLNNRDHVFNLADI